MGDLRFVPTSCLLNRKIVVVDNNQKKYCHKTFFPRKLFFPASINFNRENYCLWCFYTIVGTFLRSIAMLVFHSKWWQQTDVKESLGTKLCPKGIKKWIVDLWI